MVDSLSVTLDSKTIPSLEFNFGTNYFEVDICYSIVYFEGNWIIKDGDGTKPSTNGTWLFADELFKIYDSMIFKAGQTLFKAQLLPPTSAPPTPTGNK